MRSLFDTVSMDGIVVIGEGEKDEAPMLYNGERVGDGSGPEVDVAVDPLEGTTLAAKGMPNALCVVAISARGSMFDPGPCVYMEKLVGGPDLADAALARRIRSRTSCTPSRERRGVTSATSWSSCSTGRATTEMIDAHPRRPARASA